MSKIQDIVTRLSTIGYTTTAADTELITILLADVETDIKNDCNAPEIPEELESVVENRVVGRFLEAKSVNGSLYDTLNIQFAAKKILEGDTTIEFAIPDNQTPYSTMQSYIKNMKEYGKRQIAAYRKLRW